MNGYLATRPFGILLAELREGAKSGILTLSRKEVRKQACFLRGVIRFAASNIRAEGFAQFLQRRGLLSEQDVAWLEAHAQGRIGPQILEGGLLPLEPLREASRDHIIHILFPCLDWKDGQFAFSPGVPNIAGEISVEVVPAELILERARRREDSALQSRLRLSRLVPLRRAKDGAADAARLRLTDAEKAVFEAAGSGLPVEQAVARAESPEAGMLALCTLVDAALVELGGRAEAKRAASADVEKTGPTLSRSEEQLLAHYKNILIRSEGADHYQILNVAVTATEEDLRKAYYGLARDLHPDRFAAPPLDILRSEMEVLFARITEAYNVLSDPIERPSYDARRAPSAPVPGPSAAASPEASLPQNPSDLARLNFARGKTLVQEQKYVESLKFLENAAELDPTRPEYFLLLGMVQARNPRQRDEAIATLTAAARLDPTNSKVRLELARLHRRAGDEAGAERWLREILKIDPHNAEAKEELGEKSGSRLRGLFGRGEKS